MDLQTALPRVLSPAQGRGALWRPKFVSAQLLHLPWQEPFSSRPLLSSCPGLGVAVPWRAEAACAPEKKVAREARRLFCMRAGAPPGPADGRADHDCKVAACPGRPERSVLTPGGQEDLPRHRVRQVACLLLSSADCTHRVRQSDDLLLSSAHDVFGHPASLAMPATEEDLLAGQPSDWQCAGTCLAESALYMRMRLKRRAPWEGLK